MNITTSSRAALRPGSALDRAHLIRLNALGASRFAHARAAKADKTVTVVDGNYLPVKEASKSVSSRDAQFQVVGAPYSLLSVSLSASQNLYTRRGTLVGLSGKAENVLSKLQVLEPFGRSLQGIPFLYQKISSTSPINALISTRSPVTSFTTVEVDGTVDWMIAQRSSLLAWTGHTLKIAPSVSHSLRSAYWGSSRVTGRGLMALVGRGQVYSIDLQEGEKYIAHPSNVVAYSINRELPTPYRFKSSSLNLQVFDITQSQWLKRFKFVEEISRHELWKKAMTAWHTLKTYVRQRLGGDRLFLQFEGPGRILIQSRSSTLNESLTTRQVAEIADTPPGASSELVETKPRAASPQKVDK